MSKYPPDLRKCGKSGVILQRTFFGTKRSQVQILSPRLVGGDNVAGQGFDSSGVGPLTCIRSRPVRRFWGNLGEFCSFPQPDAIWSRVQSHCSNF